MRRSCLSCRDSGFTLVELVVAIGVLSILMLLLGELVRSSEALIDLQQRRMSVDLEARAVFNRMTLDFQQMVARPDVDCILSKQTGNDEVFFYSEAPGYFSSSISSTQMAAVSLVGYRINANYQLERLGKGLTWSGQAEGTDANPGSPLHLAWKQNTGSGWDLDELSFLDQNWPATLGTAPTYAGVDASCYRVLGPQTFRFEIVYLLKDGTLSTMPVLSVTPVTWTNGATFFTSNSFNAAGSASYDSTEGYAPGSRWYDSTSGRAYICLSATPGAAVWNESGASDIAAFVVTLGLLDSASRLPLTNSGTSAINLAGLVSAFADPAQSDLSKSVPVLPAATWNSALDESGFAQAAGVPASAPPGIAVYQRFFYTGYEVTTP